MSITETDPEFAQYSAAFVEETLQHAALSVHDRFVVQLGAVVAVGAHGAFRDLLGAALDESVAPVAAKEVVYQAVAYVGFARASEFVGIANEVLTARGVALPLPGQSTTTPENRLDRGRSVQAAVVGSDVVDSLYEDASEDTLHFQRFLSGNCFGDTVGRSGLDLRTRELLTFAMLVALGGADSQARSHVAANLRVGNTRADLLGVLTVLVPWIGYPRTLNGLAAVNEGAPAV